MMAKPCSAAVPRVKISNLQARLDDDPLDGHSGLAHTRWATHGAPTETNAHPHHVGRIDLVHNGIIENYDEIRSELPARNYESDTDTEVAAHLIDEGLKNGKNTP